MDISQETEDYIRESIEHSMGLPVASHTLQLKLRAAEDAYFRLRNQYFALQGKLKEKDQIIERARAESSMNAQALKKFVEENQKLAVECSNLLAECKRWERECSLYDNDREALMEFGNEADERAKEAEARVRELEEEVRKLEEELQFYKYQCEAKMVDSSSGESDEEQVLVESLLSTIIDRVDIASTARAFLEANNGVEVCQRLLSMQNNLSPRALKVIALIAEVKSLQNDKEHLKINLHRAEDEVKVLFEENSVLDEENKRLLMQCLREKRTPGTGGHQSNGASTKGSKRKSSPKMMSSPVEKKIDFGDIDSLRQPLSPLQHNSPEPRLHKK